MTEQMYEWREPVTSDPAPARQPPPLRPQWRPPSLLSAIRQYPMLVLLPIVVLAAAGVTYGLKRPPVYSASSEINVGVPNSDSQATPGYALAAQQLASSYSREATSQVVIGPTSRVLKLGGTAVASRLSSSAVPDSPTFYVNATGPSAAAAVRLANVATGTLRSAVNDNLKAQSASHLLIAYTRLQATANQLTTSATTLQGKRAGEIAAARVSLTYGTVNGPPKITAAEVAAAKLAAQTAQLKAQTAAERYTAAESAGPSESIVVLFAAQTASDDRATVTERYGIVGALAGLVIGASIAFLFARWRTRRASAYV